MITINELPLEAQRRLLNAASAAGVHPQVVIDCVWRTLTRGGYHFTVPTTSDDIDEVLQDVEDRAELFTVFISKLSEPVQKFFGDSAVLEQAARRGEI